LAGGSRAPGCLMKINKEIRQLGREMLRASFTDGQLDPGKIASLVQSLITRRPRRFMDVLQYYKRLLRLEIEKRHARIEGATQLAPEAAVDIVARLKRKYGEDLTTEFIVDPTLLGGVRVRVGSDVWDGTLRNRLERLQQQL
ncbi:MAG TPA: F0F1 ATP synthase subunit delta, partial [Chthoniobacterales bacterium]|nr:F0F1 ATP synthase subunit delta [Chthoniobacterales bacterium]